MILRKNTKHRVQVETEEDLEKLVEVAFQKLKELYGEPIGEGRNRVAFRLNDDFVIKLPKGSDGFEANYYESSTWKTQKHWLARCGYNDEISKSLGIPVLIMEYISPYEGEWANLPDWAFSVDCCQVGYSKDGSLKAYDWAY